MTIYKRIKNYYDNTNPNKARGMELAHTTYRFLLQIETLITCFRQLWKLDFDFDSTLDTELTKRIIIGKYYSTILVIITKVLILEQQIKVNHDPNLQIIYKY